MSSGSIRMMGALLTACVLLLSVPSSSLAQAGRLPASEVGIDQRLGERIPLGLRFRDEAGEEVALGRYFRDRPVILALAYYECPMLCTLVLNGLVSALRALSFDVGKEFEVVTVSIDPDETANLAAAKKQQYLSSYRRPGAAEGWHFLTGGSEEIASLARAVGFRYRRDPVSGEFAHAAGITLLTPKGEVARYMFGVEYAPRDLRFGLIEAGEGRIGSPIDQLLLLCFRYDPSVGRYTSTILTVVRLAGVATVAAFLLFLWAMRRRERRAADAVGVARPTPGRAEA